MVTNEEKHTWPTLFDVYFCDNINESELLTAVPHEPPHYVCSVRQILQTLKHAIHYNRFQFIENYRSYQTPSIGFRVHNRHQYCNVFALFMALSEPYQSAISFYKCETDVLHWIESIEMKCCHFQWKKDRSWLVFLENLPFLDVTNPVENIL